MAMATRMWRKIVWSGAPGAAGRGSAAGTRRRLRVPVAVTALVIGAALVRWARGRRVALVPAGVRPRSR
jgi:hypothetical protein